MLGHKRSDITYTGRIKHYPDGSRELMACSKPVFRAAGWEERGKARTGRKRPQAGGGDLARAVRRARQQVRDLALCNPMTYFVTLTLDQVQVDRYDMAAITRKLNAWLSNQVQRRGLKYILVPERHKDGAVHFHGFFNDALEVVDSGTVSMHGGKPKRPRSDAQRAAWLSDGGHVVYNLPGWSMGFTTAIELYGDYDSAVGYVCKYIGKDMPLNNSGAKAPFPDGPVPSGKIGGRWYYSGGDLDRPEVELAPLDWRELAGQPGAYQFTVEEAGACFVILRERGDHLTFFGKSNTAEKPLRGREEAPEGTGK